MTRKCDKCTMPLPGKKGHGFPVQDGMLVWCGDCAYPKKDKRGKERGLVL